MYVIQAYTTQLGVENPPMSIETIKVPVGDDLWTSIGEGDPVRGLYFFASRLMDSIMGGLGFPTEILEPMVRMLPVATVFLNENYAAMPEAVATLEPGQHIGDLPEDMRKERRSLHGIDNLGKAFSLDHIRNDDAVEQEIQFEHQALLEPGLRGLGRMPICLKMILDACEAHYIMGERVTQVDATG